MSPGRPQCRERASSNKQLARSPLSGLPLLRRPSLLVTVRAVHCFRWRLERGVPGVGSRHSAASRALTSRGSAVPEFEVRPLSGGSRQEHARIGLLVVPPHTDSAIARAILAAAATPGACPGSRTCWHRWTAPPRADRRSTAIGTHNDEQRSYHRARSDRPPRQCPDRASATTRCHRARPPCRRTHASIRNAFRANSFRRS